MIIMDERGIEDIKEYWRTEMEAIRIHEEELLIIEQRRIEHMRIMEEERLA
jgi:hypothetical protein